MVGERTGHTADILSNYRPRLTHAAIVKAPSLLPMLYKLSELEQELGVPQRTLSDWLAHGMPHHRDATGHLWINGRDLACWSRKRSARLLPKLAMNQAYCLLRRKGVQQDGQQDGYR